MKIDTNARMLPRGSRGGVQDQQEKAGLVTQFLHRRGGGIQGKAERDGRKAEARALKEQSGT